MVSKVNILWKKENARESHIKGNRIYQGRNCKGWKDRRIYQEKRERRKKRKGRIEGSREGKQAGKKHNSSRKEEREGRKKRERKRE